MKDKTTEEDGRVVTMVSINAGGVEPILKNILYKESKIYIYIFFLGS